MARLNLTLDEDTYRRLSRHARIARTPRSAAARKLLSDALDRLEANERARALAAAYIADRQDPEARSLLEELESGQLELLVDEHA